MANLINNLVTVEKTVSIDSIIEHPKRTGIYTQSDIEDLSHRISALGYLVNNPKVAASDNGKHFCYDGLRRVAAYKLLGWDEITVDVVEGLSEEDELLYIVECNDYRVKTPREKYHELKIYQKELPKRQGKRTDLAGTKKINSREAIADKAGLKVNEVRDILSIGDSQEELLDSIDNITVYLSALATKVRKSNNTQNGYVAVRRIDLEPVPCPFCNTHPTPRIVMNDKRLFYANEVNHAA